MISNQHTLRLFLSLTALVALTTSPTASANDTKRNIKACKAALTSAASQQFPNAEVHLKSIQGGVKQRIRFILKTETQREKVTCRVRRAKVQHIDWGTVLITQQDTLSNP